MASSLQPQTLRWRRPLSKIGKTGSKAWIFQFKIGGRERQLGLGSLDQVSLAEARLKAQAARGLVKSGTDPIEVKRAEAAAKEAETALAAARENSVTTFEKVAADYIAVRSPGWRSAKHADQWTATLCNYAYPVIGRMDVAFIQTDDIVRMLKPIWISKTETATRLRARIHKVLDYAKARKLRTGDNPARLEGELEHLLTSLAVLRRSRPVRPMPALPYAEAPSDDEIRAFVRKVSLPVRKNPNRSARLITSVPHL